MRRIRAFLPAWVTLGAACLPGLCPACWPGYIGLLSTAGIGATGSWIRSPWTFAAILTAALAPLVVQLVRRRAWDAGITAMVGAALLIEARWLGSNRVQAIGTILLVASALASTWKPTPPAPALIALKRRDETCAKPC